mmetsp:Transcript_14174/g.30936  ORF Transcript_14174/g.30936 Transcript_14174/m.30936 type:complete len:182 (+) Transcript_14174:673-1218(+)
MAISKNQTKNRQAAMNSKKSSNTASKDTSTNTLELTPEIQEATVGYTKQTKLSDNKDQQIMFSWDRDTVPKQLAQQHVPLRLWQKTYDVVERYTERQIKINGKTVRMLLVFPLVPFQYPVVKANQRKLDQAWVSLEEKLQEPYLPFGVKVSLAREELKLSKNQPIIGLRFQVVEDPKAVAQ